MYYFTFQITAEIDLRKSSEYEGLDGNTGHVNSLERLQEIQQNRLLEEDTAKDEGIKEEDFDSTKKRIRDLRRVLTDIQIKQGSSRHRMTNQGEVNQHSHARMVVSSLVQTTVFILATGFQIYQIRSWFSKGSSLLVR